nr:hypothetical protein [Polaromonas sp. CG_9.11]
MQVELKLGFEQNLAPAVTISASVTAEKISLLEAGQLP